jgi:hypothetical protein
MRIMALGAGETPSKRPAGALIKSAVAAGRRGGAWVVLESARALSIF